MKYEDIQKKIISTLHKDWRASKNESDLSCDTTIEDLDFDSLDQIEFTMEVEDIFSIELQDEALEKIKTIGHIVDMVDLAINFEKGK